MSTLPEHVTVDDGVDAEATDRDEQVRTLLIAYQHALTLVEKLAIALLDSVQPDAEPMTPEQARERRHAVADAMTMVAAETPRGEQLWRDLGVDRRHASSSAPLPPSVPADRRRKLPRRATPGKESGVRSQ